MLSLLHIENIAVIQAADIKFDRGFNALTGETGAGKSIVVDAIGAITGERTSRELIRTGAKSAQVSAVFTGLPDLDWFRENGMGPDEDGNLLLQREIQPDGKNVCRLGGRPITVAQLRQLGGSLLNIHGQHDGQLLLDEERHGDYLDSFGRVEKELGEYRARYQEMDATRRQIRALRADLGEHKLGNHIHGGVYRVLVHVQQPGGRVAHGGSPLLPEHSPRSLKDSVPAGGSP